MSATTNSSNLQKTWEFLDINKEENTFANQYFKFCHLTNPIVKLHCGVEASLSQLSLLRAINDLQGLFFEDISNALGLEINNKAIAEHVKDMQEKGWVTIGSMKKRDHVKLTGEGQALLLRAMQKRPLIREDILQATPSTMLVILRKTNYYLR